VVSALFACNREPDDGVPPPPVPAPEPEVASPTEAPEPEPTTAGVRPVDASYGIAYAIDPVTHALLIDGNGDLVRIEARDAYPYP
jgi:hypothetical protein